MRGSAQNPSARATSVLLVEADPDARARHEYALTSAGFDVVTMTACPGTEDVLAADVVVSDIPSFHWLQEHTVNDMPPMVALAGDVHDGVTACLCGASAWVPSDGDGAYLLDTLEGVLFR